MFGVSLKKLKLGVKMGLQNPMFAPRYGARLLNRLYHTRGYMRSYNPMGIDLFEEDWDSLLLIDGCRADIFPRDWGVAGTLSTKTSRGSNTFEFLRGNIDGRNLHDTVYITASPIFDYYDFDTEFHDVIQVWKEDGWDKEHGTVTPETVNSYVREAAERYPDKRLFVHYVQPHYPFVTAETDFDKGQLDASNPTKPPFWIELLAGSLEVDHETVWQSYTDNLSYVLPYIESVLTDLTGKTVVTSDHGNLFAESGGPTPLNEWGHPPGIYAPKLVEVPWFEVEADTRGEITADPPVKTGNEHNDKINDRLRDLGYI